MTSVTSVFNLFRRKNGKWHEVRWRNDSRQIFMTIRFANGEPAAATDPVVEQLPPEDGLGAGAPDAAAVLREIDAAVAQYNRMNVCALRVAGVRYRATEAAEPIDFGTATRKMLNLL